MENRLAVVVRNLPRMFYNADISFIHIFKEHKKPALGRWNLDYCVNKQEIKSNNANRDHCGDVICGSPEILKETYKKE
tara:strand:+ start:84 stop:317 length:234 start_codon:yes stop_codon:yes gene_type:complete